MATTVLDLSSKVNSDQSDRVDNYGLLRADGTPKPAYTAFKNAATGTAPASAGETQRGSSTTRPRLRVLRRSGSAIATGMATGARRVLLDVSCAGRARSASRRGMGVRVRRNGRFERRLGTVAGLKGCRVTALLPGATVSGATVSSAAVRV